VICQLEVLRHCFPSSVRHILGELPESLDETYERILWEIRKPNQEHAHRMLQCLVAAVRPLEVEELAEVLAFDFDAKGTPKLNPDWRWKNQEEAIMSTCSSLVMIVKHKGSRVVLFSHFSVKEFLTADRLGKPVRDVSRYHIQLDAAHTILAQACLGEILQLDHPINCVKIDSFPLSLYAGQYWTTHAQFETVSSRIKDGMVRLFDAGQPQFDIWLLLLHLCNKDAELCESLSTMCPKVVPLYYAAKFGFRDLAEHLIAEHPDHINLWAGFDDTPMHAAARAGHINILSLLLDHGADVDVRDENGETPLLRASWAGKREAGWYLINRGADINAAGKRNITPVFVAFRGHVESARMLLERGAVIDIRNIFGETPLHQSIRWGRIKLVRLFLEHGADPNLPDNDGVIPSEMALRFERPEIAELLLEYGTKPVNLLLTMTLRCNFTLQVIVPVWQARCIIYRPLFQPPLSIHMRRFTSKPLAEQGTPRNFINAPWLLFFVRQNSPLSCGVPVRADGMFHFGLGPVYI
jgi:ankyrin repeat protein